MREERLLIGDVPTRLYDPGDARALLLLGHGGGHSKDGERFVRLSRRYADQTGLAVVCIDAVDHGERRPAGAAGGLPSGWHSRTIPRMVADWQLVVDDLSSIGPPIAFVGFSMGALFGFATVASMPTIAGAVFVVGGIPSAEWTDDPELEAVLVRAAGGLGSAHVLMLNKEEDDLFLAEDARRLFEAITARSKKLQFFRGGHDEWGPNLLDSSFSFLTENVASATDSTRRSSSGDGQGGGR